MMQDQRYVDESMMKASEQNHKCCLCGNEFDGMGNNARPLMDGRCCDHCNMTLVMTARLKEKHLEGLKDSLTFQAPKGEIFNDEIFFNQFGIKENDRLRNYQLTKMFWEAKMNSLTEDDLIGKESMDKLKVLWNRSYKASMDNSMPFSIDEDVIPMLLHTDCQDGEFPFPNMFIDAKVQIKGRTYFGFHVGSYYTESGTRYKAILTAYAEYRKYRGERIKFIIPDFIMLKKDSDEDLPFRINDYFHNKIKSFIFSFCAFINEPDVTIIDHPLNPKNNKRRIQRGNNPLPAHKNVKVSGKLRIYIDKQNSSSETHNPYNYRFWVRGFYRHFFDKKKYHKIYELEDSVLKKAGLTYSEKHKGILRKWVKPFIKGQGILIKQSWEVTE